ncbi:MAG TPA: MotA/TolQ/ExbB proton channel family protein [Polyangiaceae bacterium]|jgi:biopolymer transport protein ExbB/biopolymer transport protein TolQ|nr:MotA/TolQ/ExbB proton channel family protein [Polyangiaceae bacterium]
MLIERLLKVALLGSSWVLYLLIGLSVVSFATMFERWLYFRRRQLNFPELRRDLLKHLSRHDLEGAEKLLTGQRAVEARVAREALRWAGGGPDAVSDAVESELARVRAELEQGSNFLGTLGNNAPFIGLFGTVLGVIIAFSRLGDAGQNTSAMGGVMAGIAEALVATGVGLFVAIPAVVGYNVIQKRIGDIESAALSLSKLISAYLKANPGAAEQRAPLAEARDLESEPRQQRSGLESSPELDESGERAASEVA